ncbi:MAG: D-alanine--D-alanine ligase [Chloroflexota bacterium]|nr:D-alanine--D-alanine ligase [Chloroflexota bacterium]
MRIGLSYDLREAVPVSQCGAEDALEEYDCLETVETLGAALESHGHSVVFLGGGREFLVTILREDVDFVFNISEGLGNHRSREAQVPSVLEMLGIPYTGSDPVCLGICLDKPLAKGIVAQHGVATPRWSVVASHEGLAEVAAKGFPLPAFVKPACEGSSKGIRLNSRVDDAEQLVDVSASLLQRYGQPVLIEEFIDGDEVTVGMVGNDPPQPVGVMRVLPRRGGPYFVYSLEVKRDWESLVDYECPAQFEQGVMQRVVESSLKAFTALGCRDVARIDFRLSREGVPYFLEVNPLPGLNPRTSDLPIMAYRMGLSYDVLVEAVLSSALRRYPQCVPQ